MLQRSIDAFLPRLASDVLKSFGVLGVVAVLRLEALVEIVLFRGPGRMSPRHAAFCLGVYDIVLDYVS